MALRGGCGYLVGVERGQAAQVRGHTCVRGAAQLAVDLQALPVQLLRVAVLALMVGPHTAMKQGCES
jgi:hypothetical protein